MIKEFGTYLGLVKRMSEHTVEAYTRDCREFAKWYREYKPDGTWRTVTLEDVDKWQISMSHDGMKPATTRRRLASLTALYRWFKRQGWLEYNPFQYETRQRLVKTLPNTIPVKDIMKAMEDADETVSLMMKILLTTGVRVSELLNIRVEDIDFDQYSIRVLGKGEKERIVYFGDAVRDALIEYTSGKIGPVFRGYDRRRVNWELHEVMKEHTQARQTSPHAFRHTYATNLAAAGMPTTTLQKLLGHTRIETTQRYVNTGETTTREQYRKYSQWQDPETHGTATAAMLYGSSYYKPCNI